MGAVGEVTVPPAERNVMGKCGANNKLGTAMEVMEEGTEEMVERGELEAEKDGAEAEAIVRKWGERICVMGSGACVS